MKKTVLVVIVFLLVQLGLYAQAAGRVPVKLPDKLSDAYGKGTRFEVTAPNIMAVRGGAAQDMSRAILRDVQYKGQKSLVVKITDMEGKFRWDKGKMFGIIINNKELLPTGAREYVIKDKFIDGPHEVGEELRFNLADAGDLGKTITIMVNLYCGGTKYTLEFWYE